MAMLIDDKGSCYALGTSEITGRRRDISIVHIEHSNGIWITRLSSEWSLWKMLLTSYEYISLQWKKWADGNNTRPPSRLMRLKQVQYPFTRRVRDSRGLWARYLTSGKSLKVASILPLYFDCVLTDDSFFDTATDYDIYYGKVSLCNKPADSHEIQVPNRGSKTRGHTFAGRSQN